MDTAPARARELRPPGSLTPDVRGVRRPGRAWTMRSDAILAAAMGFVTVCGAIAESHPSPSIGVHTVPNQVPAAPAAAYALVAVSALVLTWRRRHPEVVLAVSLGAVVAYTCLGYVNGAALLNPLVALYAVAVAVETRRAVILSLVTMVALMASSAGFDPLGSTSGPFVVIPGEVAAPLFLGLWVAGRRAFARRTSEDETRRRVDAERLRIARELHDVVAHTMATINVQAGVAAHVIADQPDKAAEALTAIKVASRDGLRELRTILNVLRQADEADPTEPAPRLAQLDALIDGTTRAGLPTTLVVQGSPRSLPPTTDLAAYRIIQESLTNALRHAGPTRATISLTWGQDDITIEVLDGGRGSQAGGAPPGVGHGITGMRERAGAVGGSVDAAPRPDGGFRVHARLPVVSPS
jgi:signal transduction histidine kinase